MVTEVVHAICWTICLHTVSSTTCLTCNVICHSDRSAALTGPNRGCLSMGWQLMLTLPLKYCQFHFYPTDSFLKIINDNLTLGLQHTEFGNYSPSFPEGRPVAVMTISLYSFSSHLFSSLFLSHILCHPPCLLCDFFFFLHLALSPNWGKGKGKIKLQGSPLSSLPSLWGVNRNCCSRAWSFGARSSYSKLCQLLTQITKWEPSAMSHKAMDPSYTFNRKLLLFFFFASTATVANLIWVLFTFTRAESCIK